MDISAEGLAFIKRFEGCVLKAYRDVGGVLTIGFGHTGPDVTEGLVWTQKQADDRFILDIYTKAVKPLNRLVTVPLTQYQFDALVSFTYNLGEGCLAASPVLRYVNEQNWGMAKLRICDYDHVHGKIIAGLFRRRTAEAVLFGGPLGV